jgi:hypothetical protein
MAIALPTVHQPGEAANLMVLTIAMVPQVRSAMTTIMMATITMTSTMTSDNAAGAATGEQGGHAGSHSRGRIHAQIKEWQQGQHSHGRLITGGRCRWDWSGGDGRQQSHRGDV